MLIATFLAGVLIPFAGSLAGLEANTSSAEKRRLVSVPQDAKLKKIYVSPDSRRLGFIARRGNKEFAVVDGISSEEFDAIPSPLTFSPNASSVAFIARNGNEQFAVVDGRRSEAYDRVDAPTFSPDSARFAYAAARGTR